MCTEWHLENVRHENDLAKTKSFHDKIDQLNFFWRSPVRETASPANKWWRDSNVALESRLIWRKHGIRRPKRPLNSRPSRRALIPIHLLLRKICSYCSLRRELPICTFYFISCSVWKTLTHCPIFVVQKYTDAWHDVWFVSLSNFLLEIIYFETKSILPNRSQSNIAHSKNRKM